MVSHPFGRTVGIFVVAASLALASSAAGATIDEITQETAVLELKLDALWRRVPTCDPSEEKRQLAIWAKQTGELKDFDVKPVAGDERLRLEDGRAMPVKLIRLEISGRDPYEKVDDFLVRIAQRSRLMDLETLRLKAEAGGTVSFTARFALPCYSDEENPAPVGSTPEKMLADHLAWLRGTHQKVEALAARADTSRLALALGALGREIGNSAVSLTEVRSAQEIVLEGVVAGASSRSGLEPALKRAGFQVGNLQTSPAQECQKFSVTARLDARELDGEREAVLNNGLFDDQTAAFCASRPFLGKVVARGAAPEGGALTLHMRDVELVHLFFALHDLTLQEFVVDPDVQGRVSVEVDGVTIEETLAAMSSVGVVVGPGPFRRVSRAANRPVAAAAPSHAPYTGEKITVSLQDSDLPTFLCMCEQISQRKISAPRELEGRVSVFRRARRHAGWRSPAGRPRLGGEGPRPVGSGGRLRDPDLRVRGPLAAGGATRPVGDGPRRSRAGRPGARRRRLEGLRLLALEDLPSSEGRSEAPGRQRAIGGTHRRRLHHRRLGGRGGSVPAVISLLGRKPS
jgi:hypothetical protein